jgi:bifunctional non-homologous end joining protein LigD
MNPKDKHLAVHVEDHPLAYRSFEGAIPEGQYGAGTVIVWDEGTYALAEGTDPHREIAQGKLVFELFGKKLRGLFTLVKMRGSRYGADSWLLIKDHDAFADLRWTIGKHGRRVKSGSAI